jgi:hypothetical protein
MTNDVEQTDAAWLAWSVPTAGLLTLGFALAVLSLGSWRGAPFGPGAREAIVTVALLASPLSGVIGLCICFARGIKESLRVCALTLSVLAILLPVAFILFVWFARYMGIH